MKRTGFRRGRLGQTTLVLWTLLMAIPSHADVKLPAIFSDHMVLQAADVVPVWGQADPGEEGIVIFNAKNRAGEVSHQDRSRRHPPPAKRLAPPPERDRTLR